jgi:hypothetical protein
MVTTSNEIDFAESEVERLEANLQNLLSLNASDIGKQMAREELDAAKARLAELRGETAPAVEETAPEAAEASSEPVDEVAPAEEAPREPAEQPASESPAVEAEPAAPAEPEAAEGPVEEDDYSDLERTPEGTLIDHPGND